MTHTYQYTSRQTYRPTDLQTYRHVFCLFFSFLRTRVFFCFCFFTRLWRFMGAQQERRSVCSTSKYYHIKFHIIPSSRLAVLCDFRLVTQTDIPTYQHTNIPTYRQTYRHELLQDVRRVPLRTSAGRAMYVPCISYIWSKGSVPFLVLDNPEMKTIGHQSKLV